MRRLAAFGALTCLTCSMAIAADSPPTWTGFYLGGHVGYLDGEGKSTTPGDPVVGIDGTTFGVAAGYDYQLSNKVVLGAFLSVPLVTPDTTYNPVPAIAISAELKRSYAVGGRIGYAVDRWMPYAFAGWMRGRGELTSAQFPAVNQTRTHDGYTVGFGLDFAVTRNWIVGGRFAYTDFDEETYTGFGTPRSIGFKANNYAVTVRYKF